MSGNTYFRCTYSVTMPLQPEVVEGFCKMAMSHFCLTVKTRRAAAPHELDPLFLNWHNVINNHNDI